MTTNYYAPHTLIYIQSRAEVDPALIEEYAQMMREGVQFHPAKAVAEKETVYVYDGYHRGEAAKRAGKLLLVSVKPGTRQEAEWLALAANQDHGLRRSNADKQKSVREALRHDFGARLSDRQIAGHCGVHHDTVGRIRKEMEMTGGIRQSTERVGADGRTIDTANIGGKAKDSPIGESAENVSHGPQILPTNERQARALSKLTPQLQREIWPVVVETAPNGVITAKHVEQVVEQALEKTEEETRRFATCPRCNVVTLEPGGVKKSCNICGWPGERKTSPPPQPSIEAEEGEEQESSDFDCPICFKEKVVHVNGGAWCMACGVKWASVESFKLDYKNYKAQRDHQRNLEALEVAAGGPETAAAVLEMREREEVWAEIAKMVNSIGEEETLRGLKEFRVVVEDFIMDRPK